MSNKEIKPYDDPEYGLYLPDHAEVGRGLVPSGERVIIRRETRWPLLTALGGALIPPLGKWHRKVYERVFEEEMESLAQELEEKGLVGEHKLVQASVVREKISRSRGKFSGSIFGISGGFESDTHAESKILFAWQTGRGVIVLSEAEAKKIEMILEDNEAPTVEFEFDASKLISQPIYAAGALVRESFRHPNGYLNSSLVTVKIRGKSPEQISQFLLASGEEK